MQRCKVCQPRHRRNVGEIAVKMQRCEVCQPGHRRDVGEIAAQIQGCEVRCLLQSGEVGADRIGADINRPPPRSTRAQRSQRFHLRRGDNGSCRPVRTEGIINRLAKSGIRNVHVLRSSGRRTRKQHNTHKQAEHHQFCYQVLTKFHSKVSLNPQLLAKVSAERGVLIRFWFSLGGGSGKGSCCASAQRIFYRLKRIPQQCGAVANRAYRIGAAFVLI